MDSIPDTINYHFTSACNMRCQYCFAGFTDCHKLSTEEQKAIIRTIAEVPLSSLSTKPRRINFVGGEPTIYPYLDELILEAARYGMRASIVTNGFNLVAKGLPPAFQSLELLGVSIDSLDSVTNIRMGRSVSGRTISVAQWIELFGEAEKIGLPLKINTVVNAYNMHENMSAFIAEAAPLRWKLFQAMTVEGQNCHSCKDWVIDGETFGRYVQRHLRAGIQPVVESEAVMRGTYAMVSPDGRFFDSTSGGHLYSEPILKVGMEKAWSQVSFSQEGFNDRTSSYVDKLVK